MLIKFEIQFFSARFRDCVSLDRVLQLLYDEVEVVPSVVGEQAGVEGEGDLGVVLFGVVPAEVLDLACVQRKIEEIL